MHGGCGRCHWCDGCCILCVLCSNLPRHKTTTLFGVVRGECKPATAPAPDGPVHDMNKVRILDRFFLGGGSDLRGFLLRSVGPTAGADAMGGNTYWASCLQLHTPLPYRPWREKFGASLRPNIFINAGSCFNRATTASGAASIANALLRPDAVSWGVGLTFRAGRTQLELNYCFPLLTRGYVNYVERALITIACTPKTRGCRLQRHSSTLPRTA